MNGQVKQTKNNIKMGGNIHRAINAYSNFESNDQFGQK